MTDTRKLDTPEAWVEAFRTTEAGWMVSHENWITPPRLMSSIFLGLDAGSDTLETQAGFLVMLCANHAIQNRRTPRLEGIGKSSWELFEPFALETMLVYNAPVFKDHLTCGTSMRYPFPYFDGDRPLYLMHSFIDSADEQFSVKVSTNDEYEIMLNGISLYLAQWTAAVGADAVSKMIVDMQLREPLSGLLKGYREEERRVAMLKAGFKTMDDDGECE